MKKSLIYLLTFAFALAICLPLNAQDEKKKKLKFNLGEKIGKLTGNLMTGKTDNLSETSVKIGLVCGTYPTEIETSESKFFPPGTVEGDYVASITFFKQSGMGMLEIEGEVLCEGEPMEYVGLGSYLKVFDLPPAKPLNLSVKTNSGDQASFSLQTIPDLELVTVNGETALPVLDLAEDIEIQYYNPPGTEGTDVKVSLITDVMGARALNHFAEFKVKEAGMTKVTIPKESLANPEIAGQLNAGQFNKGENYLIIEREIITGKESYGYDQKPGNIATSEIKAVAYSSMPVIVKGKQDGGLLVSLRVTGLSEDKTLGYEFYKPNANSGIPISRASRFGLVSFTMTANTLKEETETNSSSWSMGNTRYTQTTTTTTTYQFPELPEENWEFVMDNIYNEVVTFFRNEYNIDFVPVESVTGTSQYSTLFPAEQEINEKVVRKSYKGTQRTTPKKLGEILSISSNQTADNPQVNMMKEAGNLDGLMSLEMNLQVAANEKGNIVLIPRLSLSITGRDETNDDKQGTYLNGVAVRTTGEPFNEQMLKSSKEELLRVCSVDQMLLALKSGIATLRAKEVELGYDKIWNIGQ